MSRIKQRIVTDVTTSDPVLTEEHMGDISVNVSDDTSVQLGYAEDNAGLWFRVINKNGKNLTIVSATPGASSTPVIDTIDTNTKSRLYIAIGDEWVIASSIYEKMFLSYNYLKKYTHLSFYKLLFLLYKKKRFNNYLCCFKF